MASAGYSEEDLAAWNDPKRISRPVFSSEEPALPKPLFETPKNASAPVIPESPEEDPFPVQPQSRIGLLVESEEDEISTDQTGYITQAEDEQPSSSSSDVAKPVPATLVSSSNSKIGRQKPNPIWYYWRRLKWILTAPQRWSRWLRICLLFIGFVSMTAYFAVPEYVRQTFSDAADRTNEIDRAVVSVHQVAGFCETSRLSRPGVLLELIKTGRYPEHIERYLLEAQQLNRKQRELQALPALVFDADGMNFHEAAPFRDLNGNDIDDDLELNYGNVIVDDEYLREESAAAEAYRPEKPFVAAPPIRLQDLKPLTPPVQYELTPISQWTPKDASAEKRVRVKPISMDTLKLHLLAPDWDQRMLARDIAEWKHSNRGVYKQEDLQRLNQSFVNAAALHRKKREERAGSGQKGFQDFHGQEYDAEKEVCFCSEYASFYTHFIYMSDGLGEWNELLVNPEIASMKQDGQASKKEFFHRGQPYLESMRKAFFLELGIETNRLTMFDQIRVKYMALPSKKEMTRYYGHMVGSPHWLRLYVQNQDRKQLRYNSTEFDLVSWGVSKWKNWERGWVDPEVFIRKEIQDMTFIRDRTVAQNNARHNRIRQAKIQRELEDERARQRQAMKAGPQNTGALVTIPEVKIHDPRSWFRSRNDVQTAEIQRALRQQTCKQFIDSITELEKVTDDELLNADVDLECYEQLFSPPKLVPKDEVFGGNEAVCIAHCQRMTLLMRLIRHCQHFADSKEQKNECEEWRKVLAGPRALQSVL